MLYLKVRVFPRRRGKADPGPHLALTPGPSPAHLFRSARGDILQRRARGGGRKRALVAATGGRRPKNPPLSPPHPCRKQRGR